MFKPTTPENERILEQLFQRAISAGKTTILDEKGDIVPQASVIYSAYYQTGMIFYKVGDFNLWMERWYIS